MNYRNLGEASEGSTNAGAADVMFVCVCWRKLMPLNPVLVGKILVLYAMMT